MKTECGKCHRSSNQTNDWWVVSELLRTYSLCPRCYRNKSLLAYRDTLLEAIQKIDAEDEDNALSLAMEVMKLRCLAVVKDTFFND